MQFFEIANGSLIYRENGETLMATPWGPNGLRIRSTFLGDIKEGSHALLEPAAPVEAEIQADEWEAVIINGNLRAEFFVHGRTGWGRGLQISFKDQNGKVLLQEIAPIGALSKKPRSFKPLTGGVNYKLRVSFLSDPTEKIYGMGQYQQEVMNLKGACLELSHRNSQASVPFYISSLGYGFLWNNAAIGEAHFGTNVTEWIAESTKQMDYWITAGNTPAEIEEAYASVVGTAPMMPEWGMGFWQCKLRYWNQEQVLKIAREYHRRGIPVDVFVIDFYHWYRCGDWKFEADYFPDPEAMIKELSDMGMKTMVSFWPQVDWRSENYQELKQKGLLAKSGSGVDIQMDFQGNNVMMDATNPRTREYVWKKVKQNYQDLGIRTYWLDEAEPDFGIFDYERFYFHAGSVLEVGNMYPREYSRLFYEGQKSDGQEDILNLVRCAWVGSQRYGALVWSGDIASTYEDFRKQICAGLHMGLAGIPWWTTDIGGFHSGNINDEGFRKLLVRWFEYGTFCPVMRLHGTRLPSERIIDKNGEERMETGADNEIWSFGEDNYEILKKYIGIREKMRGYTRSLMAETHEKGSPVIRTLFYEFPQDAKTWDVTDEYLFGGDILVAPICHEGDLSREVYLPEGAKWTLASTGEVFEGGQCVTVDAPIDVIPLFLRDGKQAWLLDEFK